MGFGAELQGKSSHEALVRVQDTEIQLLENVKKCVLHRIKIDRDYSNALSNMVAMAQKFENSEFQSPIFEAWNTIINQTEAINTLLEKNANQLCLKTLDKIIHLINEKKATRKAYIEERQRLEIEFAKLQEEVQKLKGEYERSLEKAVHDKARYEDLYMKGKPGSKFEDAKIRFVKSTNKLHKVHNSYLIALKEVNLHQQHYLNTTLPGLLDFQQSVQQVMIRQFKEILLEYEECTDTSHEEFAKCHRQMLRNINLVNSVTEYTTFLQKSKSDQLKPAKFEFDKSLLDPYTGTLVCNQLAVDDLTIDSLQLSCASFDDKANSIKNQHDERNRKLKELEKEMEKLAQQQERDSITQTSYDTHERACETLRRELAEMKCNEAKYRKLHEFLNPLIENPDEVPAGLDLPDIGKDVMATSSTNYSKLESIKSTLLSPFRKTPASPSSPPPERDQDYNEMVSKKPSGVPVLPMNNSHSGSSTASEGAANLPRSTSGTSNMSENYQQPVEHLPDCMTLNPNRKIAEEDWFHGVLPRDEVIRLLKEDGDYLVRESRNRKTNEIQYVLSVMWGGHKHFIIQGEDGKWRFEGDSFPTIQELIIHQHKSGKPVTHKSKALLKNPIVRERWELNNDDIDITENIGKGNFGEVHRGFYKSMDMEVAVKTCKETVSDDMTKKFLQEGRILMQYDHPNIVKFIGIAAQRQPIMIVMEYVPGGALLSFLRKEGQSQTVKQMSTMCENAAAGMDYLEKKNCIHRDLAARNCLVGKDNVIKISDFGMSREEEEYTVSQGLNQIPIKWTAPEALHFGRYTSLCDVWSYGVLMWEVFSCGATPYPGLSNNQAREKIDNGYRMPKPGVAPQNIYDLMLRCWEGDPEKRPHFEVVHSDLQRILQTL